MGDSPEKKQYQKDKEADREEATSQLDRAKSNEDRYARIRADQERYQDKMKERFANLGNTARDNAIRSSMTASRQGGLNPALASRRASLQSAQAGANANVQGLEAQEQLSQQSINRIMADQAAAKARQMSALHTKQSITSMQRQDAQDDDPLNKAGKVVDMVGNVGKTVASVGKLV